MFVIEYYLRRPIATSDFWLGGTKLSAFVGYNLRTVVQLIRQYNDLPVKQATSIDKPLNIRIVQGTKTMCGIVGVFYFDRSQQASSLLLTCMARTLAHRGPDDEQVKVLGNVGFGFRRLSIIDLVGSVQPMGNEAEDIWLVFNGEIYNFQELRPRLVSAGHQFRTEGDTEVIIHSYEQDGLKCFDHFRGMFDLAIYDSQKNLIVLAVDPFGEKPLYYSLDEEKLIFASELKAILEHPNVDRSLDTEALDEYFTYGAIGAPRSIFRSIRKVSPGSYLIIDEKGNLTEHTYWRPSYPPLDNLEKRPLPELAEELEALLLTSVRRRMIADVPLGAFLSGGVDSSSVVALMAQLSSTPIKTFSIGFKENKYNEAPYAQELATFLGTDHHTQILEPDALEVLPDIVHYYDEPFADSSAIPSYYVSRFARQHVTVALSGDGGDELFGGYGSYTKSLQLRQMQRMLPGVFQAICALNRSVPRSPLPGVIRERFDTVFNSDGYFFPVTRPSFFNHRQRRFLFDKAIPIQFQAELYKLSRNTQAVHSGLLNSLLYTDATYYLPADLLTKMDRASMIHSLEVRIPLLDRDIFDFVSHIPQAYKNDGKRTKIILRYIIDPKLPKGFLERPKKGFAIPVGQWMRTSVKSMVEDVLFSQRSKERGIFNTKFVRQVFDWHQSNANFMSTNCLWSLLMFELWAREYLDKTTPIPESLIEA